MNNKLRGSKTRFPTLRGRTTLVKSILDSSPTYTMQCNLIPHVTPTTSTAFKETFFGDQHKEKVKCILQIEISDIPYWKMVI